MISRDYSLGDAEYVVEATHFEMHCLWVENDREKRVTWEQVSSGYMHTVGYISVNRKKMPVTVTVFFAVLNGKVVAFYESTSQVVDHRMVEAWVKSESSAHRGGNRCDGMNFHQCLSYVRCAAA